VPSWLVATGSTNGLVRFTDAGPIAPSGNNVQCALADNDAASGSSSSSQHYIRLKTLVFTKPAFEAVAMNAR